MNAKILEIFPSIQGEGPYAGVRQVFVRFFECNMHCTWCDTPNSIGDTVRNYKDMSLDEIMGQIRALGAACHSVSLTGGEPLLQKDMIKALMPYITAMGLKNYLETNGTLPEALAHVIDGTDIVAMDIKLPSSTKERAFWPEHEDFLRIAQAKEVFIKTVITNDTADAEVRQAVDLVARVNPGITFILQPNFFEMKNGVVAKCEGLAKESAKYLKDVRIIPQMHKFMKLR
jgi:7-carboxy-7-deazaguanine synthase